jgi:hypothetical protein
MSLPTLRRSVDMKGDNSLHKHGTYLDTRVVRYRLRDGTLSNDDR